MQGQWEEIIPKDTPMPEVPNGTPLNDSDRLNLAIERLNRAVQADPDAMRLLFQVSVTCNEQLADDPTVPVRPDTDGVCTVSTIGLMNGLLRALLLHGALTKLRTM